MDTVSTVELPSGSSALGVATLSDRLLDVQNKQDRERLALLCIADLMAHL